MKEKTIGITLGIAFILFVAGITGSDLGLPTAITSKRIGILLLIYINSVILFSNDMRIKVSKIGFLLIISCLIPFIGGLIAIPLSPYYTETSLIPVIVWFLIACTLGLLYNVLLTKSNQVFRYFLNSIIIFGSIMVMIYFFTGLISIGNLNNGYMWRSMLNDTSNGLSRIMNGLLVINIANLLIVFNIIQKRRFYYLISLFSLVIFFILVFITGSRQTLFGFLAATIVVIIINLFYRNKFRFGTLWRITLTSLILLFSLLYVIKHYDLTEVIVRRFANTSFDSESDQLRITIIKSAFNFGIERPLFGLGPNAFNAISGLHTHNGYAYMFVNFGLIPTFILIGFIIISLITGLRNLKKINCTEFENLYIYSFVSVLVYSTVSFMFNDLFNEYFFWILVAILLSPFRKYQLGK